MDEAIIDTDAFQKDEFIAKECKPLNLIADLIKSLSSTNEKFISNFKSRVEQHKDKVATELKVNISANFENVISLGKELSNILF